MTPDPEPTPTEELEVIDGVPVLAGDAPAALAESRAGLVPARHVAALAATGFAAGAATVALAHRRRTAKVLGRRRKRKALGFGEVVTSNSFLVDVHLLRRD